jgi:predicted RNA-binding protein YlxR (DUF448 family)
VPRRRCVGCGRIAPKSELVRIAATARAATTEIDRDAAAVTEGGRSRRAVLDRAGTLPGRGAYLCRGETAGEPAVACLALALRRGGIARALRCAVTIDPKLVESMSR